MRGRSIKWQTRAETLVAGKLALHDVLALEPYFDNGYIAQPRCLTPWVQHAHGLADRLAYLLFANRIRLDHVETEDRMPGLQVFLRAWSESLQACVRRDDRGCATCTFSRCFYEDEVS